MMFLEDDDLFGGSPEKKYFDTIFNANQNLVEYQLLKNLERIAVLEHLLEEKMGEDVDLDKVVREFAINNPEIVSQRVFDLQVTGMGDIISQNE